PHFDTPRLFVAEVRGAMEQVVGALRDGAVVDGDVGATARHAAEDAAHQVIGAEGAIHEPDQALSAFLDGRRCAAASVDGDIDEKARLNLIVDLLHELHASRSGRLGRIAGAFHGFAPDRLAVHVEAERRLIALVERFEMHDRVNLIAFAGRAERKIGNAELDERLARIAAAAREPRGEADTLYSGVVRREL